MKKNNKYTYSLFSFGQSALTSMENSTSQMIMEYSITPQIIMEISTYHSSQYGVGYIPGMRADGEGGRVAEHDGRMRSVKDVAHDLVRHVRKVNEHAQAVHLRDRQLLRILHMIVNAVL